MTIHGFPTPGTKGADALSSAPAASPLPSVGDRIRLICTDDDFTLLRNGDEGEVTSLRPHVANTPWTQITVKWDNGSTLILLSDVDRWEVIR